MLFFLKGNGTSTSKTMLPSVWHPNTEIQIHKYTNKVWVKFEDRSNSWSEAEMLFTQKWKLFFLVFVKSFRMLRKSSKIAFLLKLCKKKHGLSLSSVNLFWFMSYTIATSVAPYIHHTWGSFSHPNHHISVYNFLTQIYSNIKDHTNKYSNIFV